MKKFTPGGKLILAFSMVLLLMVLSACTGSPSPARSISPTPPSTAAVSSPPAAPDTASSAGQAITIDLTAQSFTFSQSTITVPAGAGVIINFNNKDSAPHNFAAYTDSKATTSIFVGKLITGPASITYDFKAPAKAGDYFFRCDAHPQMTGKFVVTP
jgi:plastocyanin